MLREVVKDLKNTRDKVAFILREFPEARNNDNLLCSILWKELDGVKHLDDIQFATSAEAIRRARQIINQRGLYIATDAEILEKRRSKAKAMRVAVSQI